MQDLRRVLTQEVAAICVTVFMADIACGILLMTFSLYARSLGASLTLTGLLGGVMGFTRILTSVPIGKLCDSRGRKVVISAGMLGSLSWRTSWGIYGIQASHLVAAVFALVGLAITRLGLVTVPQEEQTEAMMLNIL